jgi:hypothetical protein
MSMAAILIWSLGAMDFFQLAKADEERAGESRVAPEARAVWRMKFLLLGMKMI